MQTTNELMANIAHPNGDEKHSASIAGPKVSSILGLEKVTAREKCHGTKASSKARRPRNEQGSPILYYSRKHQDKPPHDLPLGPWKLVWPKRVHCGAKRKANRCLAVYRARRTRDRQTRHPTTSTFLSCQTIAFWPSHDSGTCRAEAVRSRCATHCFFSAPSLPPEVRLSRSNRLMRRDSYGNISKKTKVRSS